MHDGIFEFIEVLGIPRVGRKPVENKNQMKGRKFPPNASDKTLAVLGIDAFFDALYL